MEVGLELRPLFYFETRYTISPETGEHHERATAKINEARCISTAICYSLCPLLGNKSCNLS